MIKRKWLRRDERELCDFLRLKTVFRAKEAGVFMQLLAVVGAVAAMNLDEDMPLSEDQQEVLDALELAWQMAGEQAAEAVHPGIKDEE